MGESQIGNLELVLSQARLAAEVSALRGGKGQATPQEVAASMARALLETEMWERGQDPLPIHLYARGEISIAQLLAHLPERFR